ncbi:MAG: hypothetical protein R3264_21930, partial [Anaerolineae bacterium]|nr:hypothetical protein [Anaerolineae bacterium]
MAKRKSKRTKGFQGQESTKKSSSTTLMVAAVAIVVLGLIAFGMVQVLGGDEPAPAQASLSGENLQFTSLEEGSQLESVAQPVDRETQFLGPDTDPATLELAEVGQVGKPTLVWFHA